MKIITLFCLGVLASASATAWSEDVGLPAFSLNSQGLQEIRAKASPVPAVLGGPVVIPNSNKCESFGENLRMLYDRVVELQGQIAEKKSSVKEQELEIARGIAPSIASAQNTITAFTGISLSSDQLQKCGKKLSVWRGTYDTFILIDHLISGPLSMGIPLCDQVFPALNTLFPNNGREERDDVAKAILAAWGNLEARSDGSAAKNLALEKNQLSQLQADLASTQQMIQDLLKACGNK